MIEEIWKDVPGYEGKYFISSLGNLKSSAKRARKNGGIKKAYINEDGYFAVSLYSVSRKKSKYFLIHRLVLIAFVSEPPIGHVACHNNGNKLDNRLENLRWGTVKSNSIDSMFHGRYHRGSTHHSAKLTEIQVAEIRAAPKGNNANPINKMLAAKFNVSRYTIDRIRETKSRLWREVKP